jgi:hypothetical protein
MVSIEQASEENPLGLPDFEGQAVAEIGVEISNAAGGLNESLKVEPLAWQHGDSLFVVLRCDITKIRFDPVKGNEDQLRRVHIMRATDAAVATPDIADKLESVINESRTKIQVAKAAAQQSPGQTSIDQALADLASGLVMVEEDEDDEF